VSSTRSRPSNTTTPFSQSTLRRRPSERPSGTGRCGVRVARTPRVSPSSLGTATRDLATGRAPGATCRSVLAWKAYSTQQCEKPSRPNRLSGETPWRRRSAARAAGTRPGWRGVPLRREKQEWSVPMAFACSAGASPPTTLCDPERSTRCSLMRDTRSAVRWTRTAASSASSVAIRARRAPVAASADGSIVGGY